MMGIESSDKYRNVSAPPCAPLFGPRVSAHAPLYRCKVYPNKSLIRLFILFLNYQVHHEDIFALSSMQNCITARDGDPDGEAPLLE